MVATRSEPAAAPRGEATRAALIAAALEQFGARGFEAASTREIAAAADANLAAIAYHFGGKEGLRAACADHVAATIREVFASVEESAALERLAPDAARDRLAGVLGAMIETIVLDPRAQPIVRFMLREMFEPSAAFERVFRALAPLHGRACLLWARATGAEAESEATRLAVFALIGQAICFRLARPAVLRRMDWPDYGPRESTALRRAVIANLDAAIAAARRSPP